MFGSAKERGYNLQIKIDELVRANTKIPPITQGTGKSRAIYAFIPKLIDNVGPLSK